MANVASIGGVSAVESSQSPRHKFPHPVTTDDLLGWLQCHHWVLAVALVSQVEDEASHNVWVFVVGCELGNAVDALVTVRKVRQAQPKCASAYLKKLFTHLL